MAGFIGYARSIPQLAADIRANLKMPMAKTLLERGIAGFEGYASFYKDDVPKVFESVKDRDLQKQLADGDRRAAAKAMNGLKAWLESERKNATNDFALGEAMFVQMLKQTEDVDVPLKDLARGRPGRSRAQSARRCDEACAQFLPKKPIPELHREDEREQAEGGLGARRYRATPRAAGVRDEKHLVTVPSDSRRR